MSVYVSVVSHGHDQLIVANAQLQQLAGCEDVTVVVKDNLHSAPLRQYAQNRHYHYVVSPEQQGFGTNNNSVFKYCAEALSADADDYYCLLNPDVIIEPAALLGAVEEAKRRQVRFATLNLVQDEGATIPDLNIKRFPSVLDFAKGFLFGVNPAAYDKSAITESCTVDWASGACLLFRVDLYQALGGFDERFFMYLEDVDICRRALEQCGEPLWYFPQFKAVHLCQQANKQLFSKHFWWFISSMLRYFWKYRLRVRPKAVWCQGGGK